MNDLSAILALARAGATGRAWDAFVAADLDKADGSKVQTLKGRLLKDRARAASGATQAQLFLQSAHAYADAAALKPDSYPLINAATMSLFAGQTENMRVLANQVLALMQTGIGQGETPYWHAATRAEAMLLLGDMEGAKSAFAEAVTHAPRAWEDHATTLRQFRQILACQNQPDKWLGGFAPPPSLYFGGMMGLAADDHKAKAAIEMTLADIGPGFGYGAIAAGADILIAEALINQGAELHVVLPCIPSLFKAVSVEPFGLEWGVRFDNLFESAASVQVIDGGSELSLTAVDIASQVAKGRAVDNAERMESMASGMLVTAVDQPRATETILKLEPSASIENQPALATLAPSVLIASCSTADVSPDGIVTSYADIIEAEAALIRMRSVSSDATFALSFGVAHGSLEMRQAQIERMLRSAANGTTIASADATMALKARNPRMLLEPLGELPDVNGAVSVFAIELR